MDRQELYKYLDNQYYSKKQVCDMSSVYFLVTHDGITEPLYFMHYDGSYFESPCELHCYEMTEKELEEYVKEQYLPKYYEQAMKHEKTMFRGNVYYEIDNPQVSPFLKNIDSIKMISESECLDWLLDNCK